MTPRDIVLEQLHHRETTPVPYTLDFEGDVADRVDAHYGNKQWRERLQRFMDGAGVVNPMKKELTEREGFQRDVFGSIWRMDRRPFHLDTPVLAKPSFEGYRWPAPEAFYADRKGIADAQKHSREAAKQSYLTAWLGWGLFETSWGIRGFENVLMDVVAEPDFYEEMLDRITDQFLAFVDFTCLHLPNIDGILFGDDWGDQRGVIIGPERWRQLFKPRYAKIYAAVHAHGKTVISHCCGSIVDIMPDVIEIGLDVLESVQPEARGMSAYELKKKWGDKLAFWGCLGSQGLLPFGTPAQIRNEVKRLRTEVGRGGGLIMSPAKALQPETPTANAVALIEAFTDQKA